MAKSKISTLELEIAQQVEYFNREEETYEKQISILKEEMEEIRRQDSKMNKQIETLMQKNNELQIANRNLNVNMNTLNINFEQQANMLTARNNRVLQLER